MRGWISGKTRICGIIGDPVEHSMSPVMHNAAFEALGLDFAYIPFRVDKGGLGKAIGGMRALNIKGLNVTIPHKMAVIPFLEELDPLAKKIGAVNTIDNDGGSLKGYNTDAMGFLQPLLERGVNPKGLNVVVLGAGGASRAITFILVENGVRLTIINRPSGIARAKELAGHINQVFGVSVETLETNKANLAHAIGKADILVNATSVGMTPKVDESPVPADLLRSSLVVYDIVYNPIKTKLLAEAEALGAETIDGLDMLVWQGALAFEKWTGQKAPVEVMRSEATKLLQKDEK